MMEILPATEVDGTNPKFIKGENRPVFKEFYSSQEFSDVKIILIGSGKEYRGHKIILAACSEVFKTMLSSAWNTGNIGDIKLEESPVTEEVFEDFLGFLYNWCVTLTEENVIPLLMLADKYMISDLIKIGIDYLIDTLSLENVIPWYKFSLQFKINSLYNKCITYISHNFEYFLASKSLLTLEIDDLIPILNSGSIVITSEMKMITLIINWVQHFDRADSEIILKDMERLLTLVRFPMMSPPEINTVETIPALSEVLPKIRNLLYRSYKFHSLGHEVFINKTGINSTDSHYFLPRIYTEHFGVEISPAVPSKSFYTPAHLSLNVVNSIRWIYTKNVEWLQVSLPMTVTEKFSVRFVVMTKKEVKGNMEVVVITDKITNLSLDVHRVHMGFCPYSNSDVLKHGLHIAVLPKII